MGLGKTIQVLALLEQRRTEVKRPSLVVVPKSLVWNWQQEAARFAPELRCLAHVGSGRATDLQAFEDADLVLTTYGTLRSDVGLLAGMEFDYLILDEAQAVKNASSDSAKAARLLRGQHRLALSGTPVENHLGELWSLFEFLNPGMLGASRPFETLTARGRQGQESLAALARVLRPFILRRTKAEVAPELPPKHEETILCELDAPQARLYRELKEHYRARLLQGSGMDAGQGKIQVLEALLRLRQVACHPGLIDPRRAAEPSAKLDVLMPRLAELREEGHKALVFSQFTSFLALVRARLDADNVPYEYLDGQTEDRAAPVIRFQTDPACPLFLVSLKAGGTGLNLTAADYVFILDPWWNPAVEAQAVDRTHRIGQDRQVFVYRLLCRDTVEEKVAALQESKRGLAESIINNDPGFVRGLDRETLEILLS
jgi:SNF2 family DNA or RNA helicase